MTIENLEPLFCEKRLNWKVVAPWGLRWPVHGDRDGQYQHHM